MQQSLAVGWCIDWGLGTPGLDHPNVSLVLILKTVCNQDSPPPLARILGRESDCSHIYTLQLKITLSFSEVLPTIPWGYIS